jgi:hypothetical protein
MVSPELELGTLETRTEGSGKEIVMYGVPGTLLESQVRMQTDLSRTVKWESATDRKRLAVAASGTTNCGGSP